jgi:signal recognition particle subunit SRP72
MGSKLGKKTPKTGGLPSPKAVAETTDLAAKKKRKKRKKKLPKNYNPNVDPDPERWLPRLLPR